MSYFYFKSQIINKSTQSAVASAAYRSGDKLYSDRDGLTKEYRTRTVSPESYILAPDHAPKWVNDRQRLWNEVEKVERQKNAQLAREIQVALPVNLSKDLQKKLLLEYCKENFSDQGMVADVSIHRDKPNNPHAHIMLTVRPFNENGSWGNKRKKVDQEVNGITKKVSVHLTNWNDKETLLGWRENYANKINEKLKESSIDNFVSHKSYKDRGLEIVPTIRLSRESYQIEKQAQDHALNNNAEYKPVTFYGSLNQEIRTLNKELKSLKELKEEQVISLNEYKKEKNYEEKFNHVRKERNLNSNEKDALSAIAKRSKGYVDYQVAKEVVQDLQHGNWSKKIDNERIKLSALKNIVNKAHTAYKEDPKQVIRYGFNPLKFKEQLKEKIKEVKDLEVNYSSSLEKLKGMQEKAKVVLDLQAEFVNKEFEVLYSKNIDVGIDQKYAALKEFKLNNNIVPISEVGSLSLANSNNQESMVERLTNQSKEMSKSMFILDRAMKKQTTLRIEHLKEREFDKAYDASLKIEQYSLQKDKLEKELNQNMKFIKENVQDFYNVPLENDINHDMLIRLQEKINNGTASENIVRDSHSIHEENLNSLSDNNQTNSPENEIKKQHGQDLASSLIQAVEQVERANDNKNEREYNNNKKRGRHQGNSIDR